MPGLGCAVLCSLSNTQSTHFYTIAVSGLRNSPLIVQQGVVRSIHCEILPQLVEPERVRVVQRRVALVLGTRVRTQVV